MKFFDYIYFRINEVYFKWDGRNGVTSIIAVSMIQSMLIVDILAIILNQSLGKKYLEPYAKVIAIFWCIAFVSFVIYNFLKYKNKYNHYKNRWRNESKFIRIIKGFMILGALIEAIKNFV